jgi:hypothetical protein
MRSSLTIPGFIALFGLLAGLSGILVLVVTVGEALWWARVESWPEARATIERCSIDLKFYNGPDDDDPTWLLTCPVRFGAGANQIMTTIHSGFPSNRSKAYPGLMNQWADEHPSGSTIMVRYDPGNPLTAIPAPDYMPNGGPRTRYNLLFLLACFFACVSLLTIAKLARRRTTSR